MSFLHCVSVLVTHFSAFMSLHDALCCACFVCSIILMMRGMCFAAAVVPPMFIVPPACRRSCAAASCVRAHLQPQPQTCLGDRYLHPQSAVSMHVCQRECIEANTASSSYTQLLTSMYGLHSYIAFEPITAGRVSAESRSCSFVMWLACADFLLVQTSCISFRRSCALPARDACMLPSLHVCKQ